MYGLGAEKKKLCANSTGKSIGKCIGKRTDLPSRKGPFFCPTKVEGSEKKKVYLGYLLFLLTFMPDVCIGGMLGRIKQKKKLRFVLCLTYPLHF